MPAITARAVIERALRLIGIAAAEQPISAFDAQSALDALNALIDSWVTERTIIWTRPKLELPLVPYTGVYTWGVVAGASTPADVPYAAPVRLEMCLLRVPGSPTQEWPIAVLTQAQYEAGIWLKTLASSYPDCVYLEKSLPLNRLHVWPVPTLPYTLEMLPWPSLPPYPSLDTSLDWPQGYERTFVYTLACDVAPEYGVEPSPAVWRIAEDAKRWLQAVNATVGQLQSDVDCLRQSDIPIANIPAFLRGWQ